jgi:hypothetical protein
VSPARQLRALAPTLTGVGVVALILLGGTAAAAHFLDHSYGYFTRDPAAITDAPAYVGFLSNIGVLLWWTSAVAAALAGWILRQRAVPQATPMLGCAALSALLGLDDLFMIHEHGAFAALIPLYAVVATWIGFRYRAFFASTDWVLLAAGIVLLAFSVSVDVADDLRNRDRYALEDAPKLLGILTWTSYFVRIAVRAVTPSDRVTRTPAQEA